MIAAGFQLIGGLILAIGWLPQIIQLITTKSSRDFNVYAFLIILLGIGCMEPYSVQLMMEGHPEFFLTNTLSMLVDMYLIILILYYKKPKGK